MNCEKCGQEVNVVVPCDHDDGYYIYSSCGEQHIFCSRCLHDFGPVRELIEEKETLARLDSRPSPAESLLQEQVATLTRERDEARAEADHVVAERDEALSAYRIAAEDYRQARIKLDNLRTLCKAADRERDEAKRQRDEWASTAGRVGADLSAARARIAELENQVFNGRTIQVHANGTWEWRKG